MADIYSYKYDKDILQLLIDLDITGRDKAKALGNRKLLVSFLDYIKNFSKQKSVTSTASTKKFPPIAVPVNDTAFIKGLFPDYTIVSKINNQTLSLKLIPYYGDNNKSKSFVKINKDTLEVVDLFTSIAELARKIGRKGTSVRYALANGSEVLEDFHVIRCEKIKTCPMCQEWIRIEDRNSYTLKANGVVTEASHCIPCETKHKRRLNRLRMGRVDDS
tara:strand:- start:562 stop:1215 length:654 start_codon:yes stop_codon:yes gene_type:complete